MAAAVARLRASATVHLATGREVADRLAGHEIDVDGIDLHDLAGFRGLADLVRNHECVIRDMRAVVAAATTADEVVTADLLTHYIAQHEKVAWMLRSMLRDP
ncbi:MAG: ferritin-like domain-containing protein [Hyphomicrobiaceae bacterium]